MPINLEDPWAKLKRSRMLSSALPDTMSARGDKQLSELQFF